MSSSQQPELRASHEDRNRVVDALRIAGGDGRLSAEELEARLEIALSASTLGELAALTIDLPSPATATPKDVLAVEQRGGKYVRDGRWLVPARIDIRTKLCTVILDFTEAATTSDTLRIDADMQHGKLIVVRSQDIVIDTDGLTLDYSKVKLRSENTAADPRLRVEIVGRLYFSKVIER